LSAVEIDKTSCYDSNTLPKGVFDKTTFVKFKISNNFKQNIDKTSVADPGCLSRILIFTHPGSWIQKQQQKRGVKKNLLSYVTIFCRHKFHKIENYFSFEMLKKKNLGQFSKNYRTFYPKNCQQDLKNMGLGSEIQDPEKTNPGSQIQGSKRHRIRIRDTG
jgi:hypothetical protein